MTNQRSYSPKKIKYKGRTFFKGADGYYRDGQTTLEFFRNEYFRWFFRKFCAQNRSVLDVHEDSSTKLTTKIPKRRRFERTLLHKFKYETKYGGLLSCFHLHHKDGNKLNNNIKNLEAISPAKHVLIHKEMRRDWIFRNQLCLF